MSANFLSLPSAIYNTIWDYCGPNEILAVASTCRMLHDEIESCMLVIDATRASLFTSHGIPIFFSDHCHSVFLTYETINLGERIVVLSGNTHTRSDGTSVWERPKPNTRKLCLYHISFRNEPSRGYILRDGRDQLCDYTCYMNLRKQFMRSAVTPAMREALSACLNMGCYERVVWNPIKMDLFKDDEMMRLFMKLFVRGCVSMSEKSFPIRRCFESGQRRTQLDNPSVCLIPQIINLFEQTLEQKEPMDCVKLPLSAEEIQGYSGRTRSDMNEQCCRTYELPLLCLKSKFQWEPCERRNFDHDDDIAFNDELVFVARIPLAANTARINLFGQTRIDSPTSLFVIFFQKRQNGLDNSEHPNDSKVFFVDRAFRRDCDYVRFDVKPEHEACFLYFVPVNATKMEMIRLKVCLEIVLDDHNDDLGYWMRVLRRGCGEETSSVYHCLLPIILLRDGAMALLGPDQEKNPELKKAFDMEGLDSTRQGLECMINVCNVLLQYDSEELSR